MVGLYVLVLLLANYVYAQQEDDKLLFVQALWRHGDRGPIESYPTNSNQDKPWPNGYNELTELGMRQQFLLGKKLYGRYVNCTPPFLSDPMRLHEIYIRSTDVNRTLSSALANNAGMFAHGRPGVDYPRIGDEPDWPLTWTPLPVHTVNIRTDHVGNPFRVCQRAMKLQETAFKSKEYRAFEEEYKDLMKMVNEKTGKNTSVFHLYYVYDTHICERAWNISQPTWLTPDIAEKMRHVRKKVLDYQFGIAEEYFGDNRELTRLRGGGTLKAVLEMFKEKWKCEQDRDNCRSNRRTLKFIAYSVHDVTLSSLFAAMQIHRKLPIEYAEPQYTACVLFELWIRDGQPLIRVLFAETHDHDFLVITHLIPGCEEDGEFCSMKHFEKGRRLFLPNDIQKECDEWNKTSIRIEKESIDDSTVVDQEKKGFIDDTMVVDQEVTVRPKRARRNFDLPEEIDERILLQYYDGYNFVV